MSASPETLVAPRLAAWRWLFAAVGAYDLGLGLGFLAFRAPLFDALGIADPETTGYVHLAAALIAVQGAGYLLLARRPLRNYDLVVLGVLYKLAYTGVAVYHWAAGQLPHEVFAVFAVVDAAMLVPFAWFLWRFRSRA